MTLRTHYYTIQTHEGYSGEYDTKEDAEHARRVRFGNRALAHKIIKVSATWNPKQDDNPKGTA